MRLFSLLLTVILVNVFSVSTNAAEGRSALTLRVGIYENPPLVSFEGKREPTGMFMDILRYIATQEGWDLRLVEGSWQQNLARLESGEIDLLPAIAMTGERTKRYQFIEQNVISNWGQIFVPARSSINSIPDLNGKRIAVLKGDIFIQSAEGIGGLCEKFSLSCEFLELSSYEEVLQAVDDGKADAGLVNRLYGALEGKRFRVEPSSIIMMPLDIRMAISRKADNIALIKQVVDRHLRELKEDEQSVYHHSLRFMFKPHDAIEIFPLWAIWLFAAILLLTLLLLAGNYLLRWKIRDKTKDLARSEQQLRAAQRYARIGYWELMKDGESAHWSEEVYQIIGLDPSVRAGPEALCNLVFEEDVSALKRSLMHSLESGEEHHIEYRVRRPDGKPIWLECRGMPVMGADGHPEKLFGFIQDITERKHSEERISTLSQALEQSPVSVTITDTDGNIEYVNSSFERVTGYTSAEVMGRNPWMLESGSPSMARYREMWPAVTAGRSWEGEFRNRRKDGSIFWEHIHIAPVVDESGSVRHYLELKEDITLQKQQEEHILHQAHFDTLTDLPNRFLALDRLSQLLKEARRDDKRVAVLFLDLDDFKKVNDTLGHETGDKLLMQAADRLREVLRGEDTVGRLGGDEFIVLLGGLTDAEDAQPVAENLLSRFREPFLQDGREMVLTASIGIAFFPDDGDSAAELLRNADIAMYQSKERGRDICQYFTKTMNQGIARRLALEEQLRGALAGGEFHLCYQPVIDIASRAVVGAEALLRWHNAALGEVFPAEFIPVAEQTGLILDIGRYVLTEAIGKTVEWQRHGKTAFSIAVNVSPRQFRDPGLPAFIHDNLQRMDCHAEGLVLEITEGVLLSGHAHVESTLDALQTLGVGIAMDDFGTGYSSLSYLRRYPFDTLKIDRSFIHDITVDSADRELVSATIAMARSLGLKVVAEGVETEEQFDYLAAQGCDLAQGYLFSRPILPEEFVKMIMR